MYISLMSISPSL